MPNSKSVVYFLLVGDYLRYGWWPSMEFVIWSLFCELGLSAKFRVCSILPSCGWPSFGWWVTIHFTSHLVFFLWVKSKCQNPSLLYKICQLWCFDYQLWHLSQLAVTLPAKGPAGPNWTSQRTSWCKLDQPKNQLIKIGPAKGPVPFGWFKLDQPKDQAKD